MARTVVLFYGNDRLGSVITNHSVSIEDLLDILEIDLDTYAKENGWEGWDYEELRMEAA